MNYFKEAEHVLSNRNRLDRSLLNLYRRQNRLVDSGTPQSLTGLDPAKPYVSGGMVNDTMTDCLDLIELQKEIKITEAKIKEIDDVINQLEDEQKNLLKLWYIDLNSKEEMCRTMRYESRTTLYDKRNRAIGEFAILFYGAPALDAI